ncbi:hypothetical protein BDD14_3943 [Edaphobacter modestus]|uniref:Uncharacterized protein n=1 Tax=Edaphobacter modestus TaxID=388466 RepID=A0A4Q7YYV9_9BACT|nr:hypothetical protein BDD14_3943 [Edaphobacter modestus]
MRRDTGANPRNIRCILFYLEFAVVTQIVEPDFFEVVAFWSGSILHVPLKKGIRLFLL